VLDLGVESGVLCFVGVDEGREELDVGEGVKGVEKGWAVGGEEGRVVRVRRERREVEGGGWGRRRRAQWRQSMVVELGVWSFCCVWGWGNGGMEDAMGVGYFLTDAVSAMVGD
jgi:hypothetical protein